MTSRSRVAAAAALGVSALAALPLTVVASSYVVRPGDTLSDIAVRHGTTVSALADANELSGGAVRVGQLLQIPASKLRIPRYTSESHDTESYTVRSGESVFSTARYFGVDPTVLSRVNGIGVNAPLEAGAVLQIPGRLARMNALFEQIAHEAQLGSELVKAVSWMESSWQQDVISPTGAVGLMQLEPYTGEWVSSYLAQAPLNIHVAADNVRAGALLLQHLMSMHSNDVGQTLAAYYQGAASIAQHGLYEDTARYVRAVSVLLAA